MWIAPDGESLSQFLYIPPETVMPERAFTTSGILFDTGALALDDRLMRASKELGVLICVK